MASAEAVKAAMEQLFILLTERVKPTEIYEGAECLTLVRNAIKNVIKPTGQ